MPASLPRRFDIGRFISFLLLAVAISFGVGAISIGTAFVAGALYLPFLYYPGAIANLGVRWFASGLYLATVVAVPTALTARKGFLVALAAFVASSIIGAVCVHLLMVGLGFDFRGM